MIFNDVVGYENDFKISSCGKLYSKRTNRILKTYINSGGYEVVATKISGTNKLFRIHRLVAEAFIPNFDSKPQVNHIDGNKKNNDVSNLEWVTNQENCIHSVKIGLTKTYDGRNFSNSVLTDELVREILRLKFEENLSGLKISKRLNLSNDCVKRLLKNKLHN